MKPITFGKRSRQPLHIEADGCIINLRRVADASGRPVLAIEVIADGDRYNGDPEWWIEGKRGNNCRNIRVVQVRP